MDEVHAAVSSECYTGPESNGSGSWQCRATDR